MKPHPVATENVHCNVLASIFCTRVHRLVAPIRFVLRTTGGGVDGASI